MTTQQLHIFNALYLVIFVAVTFFTRPTPRRLVGAIAGSAAAGAVALGIIIAFGEHIGWWHFVITWEPYFIALMWLDFALCGFIFLVTWRIARRFGGRGLLVAAIAVAIIGPPRDQWYVQRFPEWGAYAPGIAPVLAIAATYVLLGMVGQGVMRLIAGPASADHLAGRPWDPAPRGTNRP